MAPGPCRFLFSAVGRRSAQRRHLCGNAFLAAPLGLEGPVHQLFQGRRIRSQYVKEYIDQHSVPEKKGLKELLNFLKKENIPVAVATSTRRSTASHYWKLAGITSYITASVCGDEVAACKPEPDIFLKAAQALQVAPENCLIVEDSINGLKAARAAGGVSCMVPDLTPYTEDLLPFCDYVCEDLSRIISLIKNRSSL